MEDQLIGTIIGLLAALAAWLKGHAEVNAVKKDRDVTKQERDTRIALLEAEYKSLKERLKDGDNRFSRFESELKTNNDLLHELIGMFKASTKAMSHQPPQDGGIGL